MNHHQDCVTETAALYGAEHLSDVQLVSVLLNRNRNDRAEKLLLEAGSMGHLLQLGPADELKVFFDGLAAKRMVLPMAS